MKRSVFSIMLFFTLLIFVGNGYCIKNEPDGFMGLKWGSSLSELQNKYKKVTLVKKGVSNSYIANSGYAKFSGVLSYLSFQYFQDQFLSVSIYFDDGNEEKLEKALIISFGEPNKKLTTETRWSGEITAILLDYETNMISFWSKELKYKKQAFKMENKMKGPEPSKEE
jgi:hypothetical protein